MFRYNLKSDNRGATMVIVLITIAVISILGAILLFTAYTGYQIKVSQAVGENRFYDAETAMDEVTAGLQGLVSDSISRSYTKLMIDYDGVSDLDDDFIDTFKLEFLSVTDGLFIFTGMTDNINDYLGPSGYTGGIEFDLDKLKSFITDDANVELSVISGSNEVSIIGGWVADPPPGLGGNYVVDTVVLRGLRVTHETPDGYLSRVDTDIKLDIPTLTYSHSMLSFRLIADFALIATGVMDSPAGSNVRLDGNAYVGSVELIGGGGPVTLAENRTLVSGGSGVVNPSANGNITVVSNAFIAEQNTGVWARNILVGRTTTTDSLTGRVEFNGNTNVAGSLILDGTRINPDDTISGSAATLSGQYYGFGTGVLPGSPAGTPLDPQLSSSIIVNGRHSNLSLSGLNRLFLAGQSFVEATGVNVATGQSIAVRSDQLAYLIPPELMEFPAGLRAVTNTNTNPVIITDINEVDTADLVPVIDYDTPLWEGSDRTLGDYISAYHPVLYPLPGSDQRVLFVFMQFADPQDANDYFIDFFEHNSDAISDYMGIYMDWYSAASNVQSTGVTYLGTSTGGISVLPNQTGPITAMRFFNEYESRRRTLTRDSVPFDFSPYPDENPFHYIVLETPPEDYYFFEGAPAAYVHHGPGDLYLSTLADLSDISMIISTNGGTVYVDTAYEGLIMCDGNIRVNNSITATLSQELRKALLAENPLDSSGKRLGDYLNISMSDTTDDDKGETWDFAQLIYYDNWKKN